MTDPTETKTRDEGQGATDGPTLNSVERSEAAEDKKGRGQGLHPDLLVVKRRVSLGNLWIMIGLMFGAIGIVCAVSYFLGGSIQLQKSLTAGGLALVGTVLGFAVLLKPVDSLNFIGMVYFSILLRMGTGLAGVLIVRQIDTPLYGKDWVGYVLAFYGLGLFVDTFLAVRSIKSSL